MTLKIDILRFLQIYLSNFWFLRWVDKIPSQRKRATEGAYKILEEVSQQIVDRKKQEIRGEMAAEVQARSTNGAGGYTKADFDEKDTSSSGGKDLLHLMMRANMAADVSAKEKLDDAELIGQITTLLIAGHETTSNQTAWTLLLLAEQPHIQAKLREEIHDHFGGRDMLTDPGYDELMSMPFLDAVCKESFRCRSAVPSTIRVATASADVPLSNPTPPATVGGASPRCTSPKVAKCSSPSKRSIPTRNLGPRRRHVQPRTLAQPPPVCEGQWSADASDDLHLGPRGCMGTGSHWPSSKPCYAIWWQFHFEPVQGWKIEAKQTAVIRSRVVGQEDVGPQMPLRVSRIAAAQS